jgi:cyclopropane-fatty-acyl-phospholipid synthase
MDLRASDLHGAPAPRPTAASLTRLSGVPARARAVLIGCLQLADGALEVRLPDGRRFLFGDDKGPHNILYVNRYDFAKKVLANGDIGFAEGWMAGDWDTDDLSQLLTYLASNTERIREMFRGGLIGRLANFFLHLTNDNSRQGSRRNILAHYDLGNRFYQAWLDPSMTYSSARFEEGVVELEAAQLAKYRALADHLELKPGEHVLEIGCGWGGFAEIAAKEYGARVTGLTLSDEQLKFARERMARLGLSDQVEIRLQDYRDVQGQFDKIASIEMFEAVGERYWPAYFQKVFEVLKSGGKAALQIITIKDELFSEYKRRADFIQRYVFPGGMLPSKERLRAECEKAGLGWTDMDAFGQSYATTLAEWGRRFVAKWDDIAPLGFDLRFRQLWRFYLSYCEAGFRTGRTDVVQLSLAKA